MVNFAPFLPPRKQRSNVVLRQSSVNQVLVKLTNVISVKTSLSKKPLKKIDTRRRNVRTICTPYFMSFASLTHGKRLDPDRRFYMKMRRTLVAYLKNFFETPRRTSTMVLYREIQICVLYWHTYDGQSDFLRACLQGKRWPDTKDHRASHWFTVHRLHTSKRPTQSRSPAISTAVSHFFSPRSPMYAIPRCIKIVQIARTQPKILSVLHTVTQNPGSIILKITLIHEVETHDEIVPGNFVLRTLLAYLH